MSIITTNVAKKTPTRSKFYAYLEFKDRLKDFIPELANGETNEQNIIPQESEFDENYAKEKDSDQTPYISENEKNIA